MKYEKILVALDSSLQATKVFHEALDLAEKCHSQLMLFYCINYFVPSESLIAVGTIGDIDTYGTFQREHKQHLQQEIQKNQAWLEMYSQQAHQRKVPAQITCQNGEPGREICNFARSWGADVIFIGRRGHRGIKEILLGSVSNYVTHNAPCAVLVVRD